VHYSFIQNYAVAASIEAGIVKDQKTFLVKDQSITKVMRDIVQYESGNKHYRIVNRKKVAEASPWAG
jgi:hypothetical protein